MPSFRPIETIIRDVPPYWVGNGFYVRQYFPTKRIENFFQRFSPFLVMDYGAPTHFKGTDRPAGIGPHPHRGIATVTFAFEGSIEHGDNQGNRGVIHPGDIQWMTAGDGILHKEYHEPEYAKNDRILHMIQLWVDLPTPHKRTAPTYQAITADQMGKRVLANGAEVIVYAGEAFGTTGPAATFSPMNIYKIRLSKGQSVTLREPAGYNTGALVIAGSALVNPATLGESDAETATEVTAHAGGDACHHTSAASASPTAKVCRDAETANRSHHTRALAHDFMLFSNAGEEILFVCEDESAEIVVLSGQPLNQPVAAQGPFVMNTQAELLEAHRDYQEGRFGSHVF